MFKKTNTLLTFKKLLTIHMKKKSNKIYKINVGENIRLWREFNGIKQDDLATKLGITKGALSKIENEITNVNIHTFEDVAELLKIDILQLLQTPQFFYNFSNKNLNEEKVFSSMDKDFIEKMVMLMDKVANKLYA